MLVQRGVSHYMIKELLGYFEVVAMPEDLSLPKPVPFYRESFSPSETKFYGFRILTLIYLDYLDNFFLISLNKALASEAS